MSEPKDAVIRPKPMGIGERISTCGSILEPLGPQPTQPEIRFLGDMERLTIGPDDKFVLTVDRPISREVHAMIQASWAAFAGDGVKLLVLDHQMKLGAINVRVDPA